MLEEEDRATLKEFVTQAAKIVGELMKSGDLASMLKARLAFHRRSVMVWQCWCCCSWV